MMQKIKFTSHMLSLFFRTLCWLLPLGISYLILFHLESLLSWGWNPVIALVNKDLPAHFSMLHRVVILGIQLLPLSITLLILAKLAKLFQLYEKGYLFEEDNITLIRGIGILMLVSEFTGLIYQPLMSAALTFTNPPGERFASLTLGTTNITTLITGLIILVISWIIKEAHQLKLDAQLTI